MLRTLKYPHLSVRVHGFKLTSTALGAATANIGSEEASVSRAAAGKIAGVLTERAASGGVDFVTPGVDIAQGAFADWDTQLNGTTFYAECRNAAGAGDDGTMFAIVGAVDNTDTSTHRLYPYQSVKGVCAAPRLLPFSVNSSASILVGKAQAVCSKAASVYTLAFTNAFSRAPVVIASPIAATPKAIRVTANDVSSVSIETYDPVGGALEDNAFYALVLGWDSPDTMSGMRRSIKVPQVAPRVEFYYIDGDAVPAELTSGGGASDGTLVDNGAGDYTITFKEPFARAPMVFPCGRDYRAQNLATASTAACQVGAFNVSGAGHAAVDDHIAVMVIGFDGDTDC